MAGSAPALQQNWQSSEKFKNFKEKNIIIDEHSVCSIWKIKILIKIWIQLIVFFFIYVSDVVRYVIAVI